MRQPIPVDLTPEPPAWIFNLAAVHREPGHEASEYFETNLAGARNVTAYAAAVGCPNLYFTSSIAVYGPTEGPTDETAPICPVSPYGGSKYPAELIHEQWQQAAPGRRLVICRPGVIYGPGDPGNILRMIRAIKRGYFAYPGSPDIHKSYGYIEGLLDSISPIHPVRVRKAARPTHIVPGTLKSLGFPFRFDFRGSLVDWQRQAPEDFA